MFQKIESIWKYIFIRQPAVFALGQGNSLAYNLTQTVIPNAVNRQAYDCSINISPPAYLGDDHGFITTTFD